MSPTPSFKVFLKSSNFFVSIASNFFPSSRRDARIAFSLALVSLAASCLPAAATAEATFQATKTDEIELGMLARNFGLGLRLACSATILSAIVYACDRNAHVKKNAQRNVDGSSSRSEIKRTRPTSPSWRKASAKRRHCQLDSLKAKCWRVDLNWRINKVQRMPITTAGGTICISTGENVIVEVIKIPRWSSVIGFCVSRKKNSGCRPFLHLIKCSSWIVRLFILKRTHLQVAPVSNR